MKAAHPAFAAACAMLAACVPAARVDAPAPLPTAAAAPAASAAALPLPEPGRIDAVRPESWRRSLPTPGAWRYTQAAPARAGGVVSAASFVGADGRALARLSCDPARRTVLFALPAAGSASAALAIRTDALAITVPATLREGEHIAALAADAPVLDALALSKGRFAVGLDGQGLFTLPSWAEVSRVIEDCRR